MWARWHCFWNPTCKISMFNEPTCNSLTPAYCTDIAARSADTQGMQVVFAADTHHCLAGTLPAMTCYSTLKKYLNSSCHHTVLQKRKSIRALTTPFPSTRSHALCHNTITCLITDTDLIQGCPAITSTRCAAYLALHLPRSLTGQCLRLKLSPSTVQSMRMHDAHV